MVSLFAHITVLKQEAVDGLGIRPDGVYVDCTLGGAGHSLSIAQRLGPGGRLFALDQDEAAIAHAHTVLAPHKDKVTIVRSNFRELRHVLAHHDVQMADGFLFDLGVSSPQLDEADRGFSYHQDAPLDMRMDRSIPLTAYDIVNEWSEQEISRILFEYGEERYSRRIARAIIEARKASPIRTTGALVELIKSGIPAAVRRTGGHPAKRSFQALRIAVNDELGAFETAIEQAIECTKSGGRISVITFHSLEDRICKRAFAARLGRCTCPPDLPRCACGAKGILRLINRKPIEPSETECEANPRARSAKLRIAEKI
jgi:16S rRNA (cytosine1402-N4)-methyltransferase